MSRVSDSLGRSAPHAAHPSYRSPAASAVDGLELLHMLDVAVVVQDAQLRIVYANPKATELLGVSTDEIVTRTTIDQRWDVITPDGTVLPPEAHPGPRALHTGVPVTGVILGVRRGDAAERAWILVSAVPTLDAHGAVTRVVISFSDVSEAQRSLRSHEALYQSVFRSMSEGLVVHNVDGSIRAANEAAERVLGLSVEQLSGRHPMDPRWRLLTADGSPVTPEAIPSEITSRTGQPAQAVLGVHRPSGELAWLDVHADPLREPGEAQMTGVLATFTDITAERNAITAAEANRAQVQRVLDAVPGIVYQYLHTPDGEGYLRYVGGRVHEITGMDERITRETPDALFTMFTPQEVTSLRAAMDHVARERGQFAYEAPFHTPSGDVRWVRIHGTPEVTADGVLYTGVMLDSTTEHVMAEALRRNQRREAMGDMAGGIAHNFNNMLAVVLPNVQLARELVQSLGADEADQHLADAERAALSAADLVRRMLTLGKAEPIGERAQVDLAPLVREALHICRQTFDRGIVIDEDVRIAHAVVRGAASAMQQVVLNLLLNARDAMQGVARPRLTVSLQLENDGTACLTVRDTGAGMSEQTMRRIGEPFFTTKPPGRGTGLGLASAFHSITEAGGTWTVASKEGEGTVFTICLPLVAARPEVSDDAPPVPPSPLSGTILIIDDERMVRTVLARQMRSAGLHAELADSANAALRRLRIERIPDLRVILLDLSMPGLSGADALPLLRAAAPGVPVIALSGHVPDDLQLDGVAAVLQKPLGQRELLDALRTVLA